MAEEGLVSIVVPLYNAERHLRQCLDSMAAQTYESIEVICVDDGSTDSTPHILDEYARSDGRFRVVSQCNSGPGIARNRGIEMACGQFITFFDGDDFCDPSLIEHYVREMEESDADMVIAPFFQFDQRVGVALPADWGLLRHKYPAGAFSWRDNPDWIFRSFENYPWNKMLRMDFVLRHSLRFQEIYLTEDLMFTAVALALANRIACVDETLIYHREGEGTNVMSHKDAHPFDFIEAFLSLKGFLERTGLYEDLAASYVNWAVDGCIYNLNTLNTYDGFCAVFERLQQCSLEQLGLFDVDESMYHEEEYRRFLRDVRDGTPERYLFSRYRVARDGLDLSRYRAAVEYRLRFEDKRLFEERKAGIEMERDSLKAIVEQREQDLTAVKDDLTGLRLEYDAQMNSAEHKIGRAVCHVPRIVQRKVLERRAVCKGEGEGADEG